MLGLKPWEFVRYTVREFEEAVLGAQIRHTHAFDLVMLHALHTGQWSRRVTFHDLTGREAPLPLDPRRTAAEEAALNDDDRERVMRAKAMLAEAQLKASGSGVEILPTPSE